jgi:hypothetical protein
MEKGSTHGSTYQDKIKILHPSLSISQGHISNVSIFEPGYRATHFIPMDTTDRDRTLFLQSYFADWLKSNKSMEMF